MSDKRPKKAAPSARRAVTLDLAGAALDAVPPDIERDTWARLAMALKSEFGAAGFDVWSRWSAKGETYNERNARDTWRSIKAGGKTTIATLFGVAKEHGFRFPDDSDTPAQAPAQAASAADLAERKRVRDIEEAKYRKRAAAAARVAGELWAEASEEVPSPYLKRKGVGVHGVRCLADGTLLVPMRDIEGELQSLQRIAPAKPSGDAPEKRYLAGGRKTGLMHWCGQPAEAAVLLLAEGYATAASLHEATGRPVAVAFDAGNLVHVARAIRQRFPAAHVLVCGDDDQATQERTGKNPGRSKALAAARAVKSGTAVALVVFPDSLPTGGTDFNDLMQHAGAEAVQAIVESACTRLLGNAAVADMERAPDAPGSPPDGETSNPFDPFSVNDSGVWFVARDIEGNQKRPVWVCSRLHVVAFTRDESDNGHGYLVEFKNRSDNLRLMALPSASFAGDGSDSAVRLRDAGLQMAPGTRIRNLLAQYIETRSPAAWATCTDRVGWHGNVYVLPSCAIGERPDQRYVFQSEASTEETFRRQGDLGQWRQGVAALCAGNSRLVFSVCCAFAGPMLRWAGMPGGGFHLRGNSSSGKTTALKVAASVYGRPSYMQQWRATENGVEGMAVQFSDALLILDEIAQMDGRSIGEAAYMLAAGREKARKNSGAMLRRIRTWLTLFLSSGEISLADHMAESGKRVRAGQEVRMIDIPADAGAGMGGLEQVHGMEGPGALADAVVAAAARAYGSAGRAWLDWACAHHGELPVRLAELMERYKGEMVPEGASEQVHRAGARFAIVAAAGEMATGAGITGWQAGEAAWAVRQCFNAWLGARGHLDNGEDASMLRQVRNFLELHAEGRLTWWHRAADDHSPKTLNRAGFRRLLDEAGKPIKSDSDHQREYGERMTVGDGERTHIDFILLQEVFRNEVCKGYDPTAVAKLLQRRGHLVHEPDRLMNKHRLPGIGKAACYHIKPSIFDDEL